MKKITKLLILPLVIIPLAGCGKIPTLKNGEEAVVTLNKDKGISANELYEELKNTYGKNIIVDMIDKIILNDMYKETDEEKEYVKGQVEQYTKNAEQYGVSLSYLLSYYGFQDQEAFEEYLKLSYRRNLAVKDYIKKNISDSEIKEYYDNNIHGDISAKHILISPEVLDGMTSEEKEAKEKEALDKANSIIEKLNNGVSFDKLAKENSDDDTNSKDGGDLGWFSTGEMDENFEKVAFALKKGEYTKTPVKSSFGYHIILKTDEKEKPKLSKVKDGILEKLAEQKLSDDSTLYYTILEEIRNDNKLKITDSNLKKQYDSYMDNLKTPKTN